ncbi:Ff.00g029750.m01.CDS01 [Fusarium sp. VM40]|nr:Ff.00g029750.m01.CDS01 [Fusarium sp. VM40]
MTTSSEAYSTRCVYSASTSQSSESRPLSPHPERPASARDGDKGAFSHFHYSKAPIPPTSKEDPLAKELGAEWEKGAQLSHRLEHNVPKTN